MQKRCKVHRQPRKGWDIMILMRKFLLFLFVALTFFCPGQAMADDALTWEDCLREAAKNHPDLIAAQEVVLQSQDQKTIARSGLFPQVDASASFSAAHSELT